ncbi:hypothetical protein DID88_004769 [Monilinia fructigena]|uniref:UBX domain-containing protein n=1 Tax=Monilinia fructigena TaxID=38457 RepID=A0A395ITF2_9HELO|nr:hypothetical protein DID88_004769 [Monilinia fructigena]
MRSSGGNNQVEAHSTLHWPRNLEVISSDNVKTCKINGTAGKAGGPQANAKETGEPSSAAAPSRFRGSGQTLGGDDTPSQFIPDPNPSTTPSRNERRTLHLWEDGFNLQSIQAGRAPLHLMNVRPNETVDVQLHRHNEPYKAPRKVYKPFSGSGQRLGSPTPGGSSGSTTTLASTSVPAPETTSEAAPEVLVDPSQPTLTLRIQLANGTRLPARFNTTQTVGDVYESLQEHTLVLGKLALKRFADDHQSPGDNINLDAPDLVTGLGWEKEIQCNY